MFELSYVVFPADAFREEDDSAPDEWVAVPTTWQSLKECWSVSFDLDAVPATDCHVQRDGWRSLTKWDCPSGLYPVQLQMRRQRWRTSIGRILSPVPPALGGKDEPVNVQPGRPAGARSTPALENFLQVANAKLPASATLIRQRLQVARASLPEKHAPASWITHQPEQLPDHLAIDELWVSQLGTDGMQAEFWTVVSDNSSSVSSIGQRVLGLCCGRDPEMIRPMLAEIGAWYEGSAPAYVSLDMWRDFRVAVQQAFPKAKLLFDRFHFERHIRTAMQLAWEECTAGLTDDQCALLENCQGTPCRCGFGQKCSRWRTACDLHEHLQQLWDLTSSTEAAAFLQTWYERSRGTQDFQKVLYLLTQWQESVIHMARLRDTAGLVPGTSRAEQVNREIRRLIRLHRLTPLDCSLERLMALLQTPTPTTQDIVAKPIADGLVCPNCGGGGPEIKASPGSIEIPVHHLPRGFDRVTLQLPSRLTCPSCGEVKTERLSPALAWWLLQPATLALPWSAPRKLDGE